MKDSTRSWTRFRISRSTEQADVQPEASPVVTTPTHAASGTFIESGAMFEGMLKLKGDFRVDTEFRGELRTDGTVVVGPGGSIEGDIVARQVEIKGAVVGNITARRLCILRSSARLHGDIQTACVEIERHAFFQGRTRMMQPIATKATNVIQQPTL